MYFEIENTPEHLKRARKKEVVHRSPKEECPRLILAPFSKPPQVVFDNVLIGRTCERILEVFNPSKCIQQIKLGKATPPGLVIHLPGEYLEVEPETCYSLTMMWTPVQPTALRETIRFVNDDRGRYDVFVVLKSIMNVKSKNNQPKFKTSPGKMKRKSAKKSPVAVYKKKIETVYNTTKVKKTIHVVESQEYQVLANKGNISYNNYSIDSNTKKCPFDSPNSADLNFNTTEIFSNIQSNKGVLQQTYDKTYSTVSSDNANIPNNILKPSNKQQNDSTTDIFDNLTFTPLKSLPSKNDKLNKGPQIILSMNSDSDFDDSLNIKGNNKENETDSILCITSSHQPNTWLTVNHMQYENMNQCNETPTLPNKKIPNTSSPKDLNSPNFSINTDFSRISELSFFPPRFSTERKIIPKFNSDTHDLIDDSNVNMRLSSDTYTKESPNTPFDQQVNQMYVDSKQHFMREQNAKMCRQALFKEYQREMMEKNHLPKPDNFVWHQDLRSDIRSPPRSLSPPLQSIPEESVQFSETQPFDKTDKQTATFTIDCTFDKTNKSSILRQNSWSKKAFRVEPELWKMPVPVAKKPSKPRAVKGNQTFEANKTTDISLSHVGNVYSQSLTVDPFLSTTYFYDEGAVEKFEKEFKRWLNCILTPPADLDSNVEQKIDVGKAWIENRNKEVPAAPTKEQVCSLYHNSHRLESLRRSARALLLSPEICQVFTKLHVQIEKKLIAIRSDRNLHLDVGLQKIIMELLLSYNPLWLRIGLEAIYGLVLPLKSNSDIEGLTTFIVHRMFKNPNLKSKNSKSRTPNMLSPAYIDAIKKYTLKKFFMLVFFLDQAKQKKLISHDPCLFCRNAICKESREIVIRFTRELIAGIGDITKHLRPLGYVVSHKQSYLDEYKYAVHNIAIDIRDGVRLTKVMEIILMKNGLLHQLRTPAISRLQKIHNVQVALNALKEADFVILGDITATDIADGHREKTLSLLWQIIHVFRAPLFERAANVIQTWWKKKYEVIVEKKREQERIIAKQNYAASIIQYWWRRIKYNRMVEYKMYQVTMATIVIQKYCRMWLCRSRLKSYKNSALKIANWYKNMKLIRQAKQDLLKLRLKRQELERQSAIIIQKTFRRWLCVMNYERKRAQIILLQSIIRRFLVRKWYIGLRKSVLQVQQRFRGKLLMRKEMKSFADIKKSAVIIQSQYRMLKTRRQFIKLKNSVATIETYYKALINMRIERERYLKLKHFAIKIQSNYKCKKTRAEYLHQRNLIISLQRKFRALLAMRKQRSQFIRLKNATVTLQNRIRSYLLMKKTKTQYERLRNSAIIIQRAFKSYLEMKLNRNYYLKLRSSAIILQTRYRSLLAMRCDRATYLKIKQATILIQTKYRAIILMREHRRRFEQLKTSAILIQNRYRAMILMRSERAKYLKMKSSCQIIQNFYRTCTLAKLERQNYLKQKTAVVNIQQWYRSRKTGIEVRKSYETSKRACLVIQRTFRAYLLGRKQRKNYLKIKTATVYIQKYYRSVLLTRSIRNNFVQIKTSTVTIQRYYRSYLETKKQRNVYLKIINATRVIQNYYRRYRVMRTERQNYCQVKSAVICIQERFRSLLYMRRDRAIYLSYKKSAVVIQRRYRALTAMRKERSDFIKRRTAAIYLQQKYRAHILMKEERMRYLRIMNACKRIQTYYRSYRVADEQRNKYLLLKEKTIQIQRRYRALITMRKDRTAYVNMLSAAIVIQRRFRAHQLMLQEKFKFNSILRACISIQRYYRGYLAKREQRKYYVSMKNAATLIQTRYRNYRETKRLHSHYIALRQSAIFIQRRVRAKYHARELARKAAADKIQIWYLSIKLRNQCRSQYLNIRRKIIIIQSLYRKYSARKQYLKTQTAAITIQRYYRCYKLAKTEREKYVNFKTSVTKLQACIRCFIDRKRYLRLKSVALVLQAVYRLKKHKALLQQQRIDAAISIQKNVRRYLTQSWFKRYRKYVTFIQRLWRGKITMRIVRREFLHKKEIITKIQAAARGYLVRRQVENKKAEIKKLREEQRRNWAASKIQALFRGHRARMAGDTRVRRLRLRWRAGGLRSTQESLAERNEEAMDVLRNMSDIETVIRAFRSLELLTEVFPMMYNSNAASIVRRVYVYMSVTNRSISSIEVLKSAASVLVNLTRYRVTGPKIYARDRIPPVLKFMWRFSNSETTLFCIFATYLWLFSKYDEVKKDLTEFLHMPENHKMLVTIKGNVNRMKRMTNNTRNKFSTPQPTRFVSHTLNQSVRASVNTSHCSYESSLLPALEPDYGITRADKPRYFEDAQQAINCLFDTYKL
ncbi:unnamed protein product [Danaus chrysippus]|uniref:(African queen) hypothetical protein n=1 Tax=Danaus chrysippus TaxID=151541 RepID=A0A8J2W761_9NEOP|nr:unnamed protein product [Danaus chrysippus]